MIYCGEGDSVLMDEWGVEPDQIFDWDRENAMGGNGEVYYGVMM